MDIVVWLMDASDDHFGHDSISPRLSRYRRRFGISPLTVTTYQSKSYHPPSEEPLEDSLSLLSTWRDWSSRYRGETGESSLLSLFTIKSLGFRVFLTASNKSRKPRTMFFASGGQGVRLPLGSSFDPLIPGTYIVSAFRSAEPV